MIELMADDSEMPLNTLLYNALDNYLSSIKSSLICVLFFSCENPNKKSADRNKPVCTTDINE